MVQLFIAYKLTFLQLRPLYTSLIPTHRSEARGEINFDYLRELQTILGTNSQSSRPKVDLAMMVDPLHRPHINAMGSAYAPGKPAHNLRQYSEISASPCCLVPPARDTSSDSALKYSALTTRGKSGEYQLPKFFYVVQQR